MSENQAESIPQEHPAAGLLRLVTADNWEALEEKWLASISTPEMWVYTPEFQQLFKRISNKRSPTTVTAMLELMLEELSQRDDVDSKAVLDIFALGYPFGPASSAMREALATIARKMLDVDTAEAVIQWSGLVKEEQTAKAAVDDFLTYYRLVPGEVFHHQYYNVGIITEVDMEGGLLKMDFPDTTYSDIPVKFEHIDELLKPMPYGHFDVLRLQSPDTIREMADNDPGKLVRRIAEARHGEVKQAQIKEVLLSGVYTDAQFKSWWGKRRSEIMRDPYLDVDGAGARCAFTLRETPKPFYQEVVGQFNEAKNFKVRLDICRGITRAAKDDAFPPEAWSRILGPFQKVAIEADKFAPHEKIGWELLRRELMKQAPEGVKIPVACDIGETLKGVPHPAEVVVRLDVIEHQSQLIPIVRETFPKEWLSIYKDLAERLTPRLCESIIKTMIEEDHLELAADTLGAIISFPERNGEAYLWAMKGLLGGGLANIPVGLDEAHLIEDLLNELETLVNAPATLSKTEEREIRALELKLSKFISDKHFAVIANVIAKMSVEDARDFYTSLDKRRIPNEYIDSLRVALRKTRNDLDVAEEQHKAAQAAQAILFCTEESKTEKIGEYNKINDIEIPAISKAIGAAAELGDLKENAEYHSAKERQKILFRRVEELSLQLARARTVESAQIDTTSISFGVKVVVFDQGAGEEKAYTILGPWESDPNKGIISYQAPLGQGFVGKKLGDKFTVELPDGAKHDLEVKSIEKAY